MAGPLQQGRDHATGEATDDDHRADGAGSRAVRVTRRTVLGAGAATAGLWVAPTVLSTPAAAQGTGLPPFVAVGTSGARAWRSVNGGATWTAATTPPNGLGLAVAADRLLP